MRSLCVGAALLALLLSAAPALGAGLSEAAGGEDFVSVQIGSLANGDMLVRYAAAMALGELGGRAAPALPALAARLKDEKESALVRAAAAEAIGAIGPDPFCVSTLTGALRVKEPLVRCASAHALGLLGEAAAPAAPALATVLGDPTTGVAAAAATALGRIGGEARGQVPALEAALAEGRSGVEMPLHFALARLSAEPAPHVAALAEALQSTRPRPERLAAAHALEELGPAASGAARTVARALWEPDQAVRSAAVLALVAMGKSAAPIVPELAVGLRATEDPDLQVAAATVLGAIGPAASEAVPALTKAAASDQPLLSTAAKAALGKIRAAGPPRGSAQPN